MGESGSLVHEVEKQARVEGINTWFLAAEKKAKLENIKKVADMPGRLFPWGTSAGHDSH